jgi:hypothetical protein
VTIFVSSLLDSLRLLCALLFVGGSALKSGCVCGGGGVGWGEGEVIGAAAQHNNECLEVI